MRVNVDGLLDALRIVEEAAERGMWEQSTWLTPTACGTAGCLAGHYVMSQGYLPRDSEDVVNGVVRDEEGRTHDVDRLARELLGLSHNEADDLFASHNTLEDLRFITGRLIGDQLAADLREKEVPELV